MSSLDSPTVGLGWTPDGGPPTAFVSWAHADHTWLQTVAGFVFALRTGGVDAEIDLFHLQDPEIDWVTYGSEAISKSHFVLIAVSPSYKQSWQGHVEAPGAGSAREADLLQRLATDAPDGFRQRVRTVVLPGASADDIPVELAETPCFQIPSIEPEGMEELLRALHADPALSNPEVGEVAVLPPVLADLARDFDTRWTDDDTSKLRRAFASVALEAAQAPRDTAAQVFLRELERLVGHRALDTSAIERAARIVAAEQSWRDGLGLLLDDDDVAQMLGINLGRVQDLAANHEIIALTARDGAARYPAFQFQDGLPTPTLVRAHQMLVDGGHISPWSAASWARTSHPELEWRSPAQWAGDRRDDARLLLIAERDAARSAQ